METTALTTLVGTPSPTVWSQAQIFKTETISLGVVLSLKKVGGEDALELPAIGGAMLFSLRENMGHAGSIPEIQKAVEDLAAGVPKEIILSVAVVTVNQKRLQLNGKGEMRAYLVRQGKLVELADEEQLTKGVAGNLVPGDTFCVGTKQMMEMIGVASLAGALKEGSAAGEQLAPLLHKEQDSSYAAAILGNYGGLQSGGAGFGWAEKLREIVKQPLKVKRVNESPRPINTWIAGAALLFLIVMIGFGYIRRARMGLEQEYQSVLAEVEQKIGEAGSIADLNPERARILLSESKHTAENYHAKTQKEPYKSQGRALLLQVEEAEKNIFKVDSVGLSSVIELPILAEGLEAKKMYLDSNGMLVFPDLRSERVVGLNIEDKSKVEFETGKVGLITSMGFFEKTYYGMTDKGVAQIGAKEDQTRVVIEKDPLWGEISSVESYAGNIYLLDKGNSEIWKYPVVKDGFGERRRWLAAGIVLDLTKVSAMKVAGDIWLVTSSGKLERYSRGAPVEFTMAGFPAVAGDKRLSDPVSLYVTEDEVYVLERGAKRVVVFGQDGTYKAQYLNEEFGQALNLVVYKNKGYVLLGETVKEFSL